MNTDSENRYFDRLEEQNRALREQNKRLVALIEKIHRVFSCPTASGEWVKSHLAWIHISLNKIQKKKP